MAEFSDISWRTTIDNHVAQCDDWIELNANNSIEMNLHLIHNEHDYGREIHLYEQWLEDDIIAECGYKLNSYIMRPDAKINMKVSLNDSHMKNYDMMTSTMDPCDLEWTDVIVTDAPDSSILTVLLYYIEYAKITFLDGQKVERESELSLYNR